MNEFAGKITDAIDDGKFELLLEDLSDQKKIKKIFSKAKTKEEVIKFALEISHLVGWLVCSYEFEGPFWEGGSPLDFDFKFLNNLVLQTLNDLDRAEQVPEEQEIPVRFF